MLPINILVEGPTDEVVIRRILEYVDLPYGVTFGRNGKDRLFKLLPVFNQDAHRWNSPWLVVVDLDQTWDCAPDLIREKLPHPAKSMCFRVVVRAIEAWLMADKEHLAEYLYVSSGKFPTYPDREANPKETLIQLIRSSTKKEIRDDMVLPEGRIDKTGPLYAARLQRFVHDDTHPWRPEIAAQCSDSLRRCIEALKNLGNLE